MADLAAALAIDASELEQQADPPAPAGDLQAEMNAFTTVAACVESRTKVDPLLGDVLEAIGYDTFLSDACQLLAAAKSRDAKRCASIDASLLRERCEATVAEVAGDPDACPWAVADRPREGRDPACLAIALRDARLCASIIGTTARATCEAVASHDGKACGRLGGKAAAQCERSATRWARAIGPSGEAQPPLASSETVTFARSSPGSAASAGPAATADLRPDVQRGLVLVESYDGLRLHAGTSDDGVDLIGPSPHAGVSFSFELFVPAGGGAPVVERAALRVPGQLPVTWGSSRGSMQAKLRLEPRRAGTVEISLEADVKEPSATTGAWHLHADVRTFVRDTVHAVDLLRAGSRDRSGRLGEY